MASEDLELFNWYLRYPVGPADMTTLQDSLVTIPRDTFGELHAAGLLQGATVAPSGSTMAVTVTAFSATNDSGYLCVKNSTSLVSLAAAHATLNRYDLIVARPKIDDGVSISRPTSPFDTVVLTELQNCELVAIQGTNGSSPSLPSKVAGDVILASVYVPAAATSISGGNIEQTRNHDIGRTVRWWGNVAGDLRVYARAANGSAIRGFGYQLGTGVLGTGGDSGGEGVRGTGGASGGTGVKGVGGSGNGVGGDFIADGTGHGSRGTATGSAGAGHYGQSSHASGFGVQGVNSASNGIAIKGSANTGSTAVGVQGEATSGYGVQGSGKYGVDGFSSTADGIGVSGFCSGSGSAYGVLGQSTNFAGVCGIGGTYGGLFSNTGSGTGCRVENTGTGRALLIVGNDDHAPMRINPQANAPSGTVAEGDIYYNSTDHKLKVYNGSTWTDCN